MHCEFILTVKHSLLLMLTLKLLPPIFANDPSSSLIFENPDKQNIFLDNGGNGDGRVFHLEREDWPPKLKSSDVISRRVRDLSKTKTRDNTRMIIEEKPVAARRWKIPSIKTRNDYNYNSGSNGYIPYSTFPKIPGLYNYGWNPVIPKYNPDAFRTAAIVNVAVVCDKEFGDMFQHNRTQILEYLTLRFFEINMGYKSLTLMRISFRVTSVNVIKNPQYQPFIENSRDLENGTISLQDVLPRFSQWVFKTLTTIPPFHIAMLLTNASAASYGGFAYVGGVCAEDKLRQKHWSVLVANDFKLKDTLRAGAHELAHVLGANHDDEKSDCDSKGYIMMSEGDDLRSFSACSDKEISSYLRSGNATCLPEKVPRTMQYNAPILDPDYDDLLPPSLTEQCISRRNDPEAIVTFDETNGTCSNLICWTEMANGTMHGIYFSPTENTRCGLGSRCFFGKCLDTGVLLVNALNNHCLYQGNRFSDAGSDPLLTAPCPRSSNQFDRFTLFPLDSEVNQTVNATSSHEAKNTTEVLVTTTYLIPDPFEVDRKCLYVSVLDNKTTIKFAPCGLLIAIFGTKIMAWEKIRVEEEKFMLRHKLTNNCLRQFHGVINLVSADPQCNKTDPSFHWSSKLVYPSQGMCGGIDGKNTTSDNCTTDLRVNAVFRNNLTVDGFHTGNPKEVILDIALMNLQEAAIAPGVEISWQMRLNLSPEEIPPNCFQLAGETQNEKRLRCKLGRLLGTNETSHVVSLRFQMSPYIDTNKNRNTLDEHLASELVFNVRAVTASKRVMPVHVQTVTIKIVYPTNKFLLVGAIGGVILIGAVIGIFCYVKVLKYKNTSEESQHASPDMESEENEIHNGERSSRRSRPSKEVFFTGLDALCLKLTCTKEKANSAQLRQERVDQTRNPSEVSHLVDYVRQS